MTVEPIGVSRLALFRVQRRERSLRWLTFSFGGESTLSLEDRFFDRGPRGIRGFLFVCFAWFAVTVRRESAGDF